VPEARIEVERVEDGRFSVRVIEGDSETSHDVTVTDEDLARLGAGYASPEGFVRACFEFLLGREPKESILRSFDVSVISRYFPEFDREITR
jgi:hypothetical protein